MNKIDREKKIPFVWIYILFTIIFVFFILIVFLKANDFQIINEKKPILQNQTENQINIYENGQIDRDCENVGESIPCITEMGCKGDKFCREDFTYSICYKQRQVCIPGSKRGCVFDSCLMGFQICNECGQEYLECEIQ